MKSVAGSVLMAFAACLVVGCGSSDEGADDVVEHPKYPELFVTIQGADGQDGGMYWYECDDGYETYSATRTESSNDGTSIACKAVYKGTTDAGDTYVLEVSVGEAKETKEVVYEGKRLVIDLADGVKFVLEPDPL